MDENIQKQIEQRIAELPEDIQQAIASSEFDLKIQEIGKKRTLHVDQMEALSDETMLVMLGFADQQSFAAGIQKKLSVSAEQASALANDVTNGIFTPIRESMKRWAEGHTAVVEPPVPMVIGPTTNLPMVEKSAPVPTPVPTPTFAAAPAPQTTPPPAPAPKPAAPITPADTTFSKPTVQTAPPTPKPAEQAKPIYKADPYREPVE